jgi:hypothetical protein
MDFKTGWGVYRYQYSKLSVITRNGRQENAASLKLGSGRAGSSAASTMEHVRKLENSRFRAQR